MTEMTDVLAPADDIARLSALIAERALLSIDSEIDIDALSEEECKQLIKGAVHKEYSRLIELVEAVKHAKTHAEIVDAVRALTKGFKQ